MKEPPHELVRDVGGAVVEQPHVNAVNEVGETGIRSRSFRATQERT